MACAPAATLDASAVSRCRTTSGLYRPASNCASNRSPTARLPSAPPPDRYFCISLTTTTHPGLPLPDGQSVHCLFPGLWVPPASVVITATRPFPNCFVRYKGSPNFAASRRAVRQRLHLRHLRLVPEVAQDRLALVPVVDLVAQQLIHVAGKHRQRDADLGRGPLDRVQ
jgi:hypothetical protein